MNILSLVSVMNFRYIEKIPSPVNIFREILEQPVAVFVSCCYVSYCTQSTAHFRCYLAFPHDSQAVISIAC